MIWEITGLKGTVVIKRWRSRKKVPSKWSAVIEMNAETSPRGQMAYSSLYLLSKRNDNESQHYS